MQLERWEEGMEGGKEARREGQRRLEGVRGIDTILVTVLLL